MSRDHATYWIERLEDESAVWIFRSVLRSILLLDIIGYVFHDDAWCQCLIRHWRHNRGKISEIRVVFSFICYPTSERRKRIPHLYYIYVEIEVSDILWRLKFHIGWCAVERRIQMTYQHTSKWWYVVEMMIHALICVRNGDQIVVKSLFTNITFIYESVLMIETSSARLSCPIRPNKMNLSH